MVDRREASFGEEDDRYRQCSKEMWLTVAFFVVNVLVTGGLALALGYGKPGEEVRLVAGLPVWFWYSGVVGSIVLIILAVLMVKIFFKEMPLGAEDEERP